MFAFESSCRGGSSHRKHGGGTTYSCKLRSYRCPVRVDKSTGELQRPGTAAFPRDRGWTKFCQWKHTAVVCATMSHCSAPRTPCIQFWDGGFAMGGSRMENILPVNIELRGMRGGRGQPRRLINVEISKISLMLSCDRDWQNFVHPPSRISRIPTHLHVY